MNNSNDAKKKSFWTSFGKGAIVAFVISFIFFSGFQFGSGAWAISINRNAVQANRDLPNRLDFSSVDRVYNDLRRKFDGELNEQALLDGMKRGLVEAAGDPYTSFLNAEETASFNESLTGSFEGIGAELTREDNLIKVVAPLSGFPAEQAGIRAQDIIVEINGEDATGISVEEAVKRIRGEKGTEVTLGILRGSESLDITITRGTITVPSVEIEYLQDGAIGYIQLTRYSEDTVGLVEDTAKDMKQKGVKGIILDVRNNPGGLLSSAVRVSEKWLQKGDLILEEKRDNQVIDSFQAKSDGLLQGIPTVVLVNEGSASASEITAGALKDNKAATLVGVTTFGKGSVQEPIQYSDGSLLKVTVARWFTPNGLNIDEEGINPDVKVERTEEDFKNNKDPQLDKAIEILNN